MPLGQRVRKVTKTATTDEAYGADGSLLWRNTGRKEKVRIFLSVLNMINIQFSLMHPKAHRMLRTCCRANFDEPQTIKDKDVVPTPSRSSHGFSLLEMMTVVTIILILATISTPYFRTAIILAREAALRQDLFTLRVQIDRFTLDYKRAPASLQELVDKAYMGSIPRDPFTGSTETWTVEVEDASLSLDDSAPPGIVDVHSGSAGISLQGTPYSSW